MHLPESITQRFGKLRPEIAFALLTRSTQAATMLAAAVCVAWRLSLEEQGFFFVFMSLGALLQLSDFGLAYAVLQTASHLKGMADPARFSGFRRRGHAINLVALSAAALIIGVLGALIFSAKATASANAVAWAAPWVAFTAAVFAMQLANLELVMVEGGRSVVEAWRVRFVQEAVGGLCFIVALLAGARLWSLALYWAARAVIALVWLRRAGFGAIRTSSPTVRFEWRKEVWPFQWRLGLSTMSGFFVFQACNPIVLMEQGAAVAGRFGMSLAIMNMLILITTVWPLSQVPEFVRLLNQHDLARVRSAFLRMFGASTAFAALMATGVVAALWWVSRYDFGFVGRLADLPTTAALIAAAVVHHAALTFAVLLRAEQREPLLIASVLGSLVTVGAIWICARYGTPRDIALANLACAFVGIPVVLVYYRGLMMRRAAGSMATVS